MNNNLMVFLLGLAISLGGIMVVWFVIEQMPFGGNELFNLLLVVTIFMMVVIMMSKVMVLELKVLSGKLRNILEFVATLIIIDVIMAISVLIVADTFIM